MMCLSLVITDYCLLDRILSPFLLGATVYKSLCSAQTVVSTITVAS